MKPSIVCFLTLTALNAATATRAATGPTASVSNQLFAPVTVRFVAPEKFTDAAFTYSEHTAHQASSLVLSELAYSFATAARNYVADNQKLTISITDIELGGRFAGELGFPAPGAYPDNVSEMRTSAGAFPPKIKLSFVLTDETGKVLKEGTRVLQGTGSPVGRIFSTPVASDYRYRRVPNEKRLIDDWYRAEFKPIKASGI